MRTLSEALIGKHNINNAVEDVSNVIDKRTFNSGDLVQLRDNTIAVVILRKDIKDANFYKGITLGEEGSIIHPDGDKAYTFSGLDLDGYSNSGVSRYISVFDIVKIWKKAISRDIYSNDLRLLNFMNEPRNLRKFIKK